MTHTKISCVSRALLAAVAVTMASAGCAAPATAPEVSGQRAFDAYKAGNKAGVNQQLSRVDQVSAAFFCQGDGWDCMLQSYHGLGANQSHIVEVTRKTDASARVQLKTTWEKYPAPLCQEYSVDRTDAGWGISYIDVLKKC